MAACYHDHQMFDRAAFSLFARDYPPRRRYFVAAGLEYAQRPALKLSPGKATWAGRKQVFRFQTPAGKLKKDIIGLRDDRLPGEPLLQKVMSRGKIAARMPSLPELRKRFLDEFAKLDERYKAIEGRGPFFPVSFSPRLRRLQSKAVRAVIRRELGES